MRDPKAGFAVVQALAPAVYSGDDPVAGSFFGLDTIRRIPGPAFDIAGFNSAALIVNPLAAYALSRGSQASAGNPNPSCRDGKTKSSHRL